MKRFMRTLVAPATFCILLPAGRVINCTPGQQQHALETTSRPSTMPFMWQQARHVSTTTNHSSATDGVVADQTAQVDRWCQAFPWLLIHDPRLTAQEVQRRLNSGENKAPKIKVTHKESKSIARFLSHAEMKELVKNGDQLKEELFENFDDIFAQHFIHEPTTVDAYLKLFRTKGPNGASLCGSSNAMSGRLTSQLSRLSQAFEARLQSCRDSLIHVQDPRIVDIVKSKTPVLVIAGESGSGKTHAALTANPEGVTIYLLFKEDFKRSDKGDRISVPDRDQFTAEIVAMCVEALPPHKNLPFMQDLPLRIVIDEMGRQPTRLHLAISECHAIFKALAAFGWDHTKIKIFCVGTGVAHVPELLGSRPENVEVQTLGASGFNTSDGNVLIELWRATCGTVVDRAKHERQLAAVAKFSKHRYISPLLDNYRAAAILVAHIEQVFSNLLEDVEESALMSSVETALFYVSKKFKSLNGLVDLNVPQMKKHCALGLQRALCGPTLRDYATTRLSISLSEAAERSSEEDELVCSLGVLTERAREMKIIEKEIKKRKPTTVKELIQRAPSETDIAALLKLPRFTMSRSVATMMLGGFGRSVTSVNSQSGEGLEKAVAMKLLLVMRSFGSIRDVRKCLMGDNVSERTAVFTPSTDSTLLKELMARTRHADPELWTGQKSVAFWELRSQFSRPADKNKNSNQLTTDDQQFSSPVKKKKGEKSGAEEMKKKVGVAEFSSADKYDGVLALLGRIADVVHDGNAALIINGRSAPYADVMLVAPGLLCFVQCKQSENFQLNVKNVNEEVGKILHMGHNKEITECLCHIAGVGREQIDILLVTTKKSAATRDEDGHGCRVRVVTPSTEPHEDFLFPFAWPSTPIPDKQRTLDVDPEMFHCFEK